MARPFVTPARRRRRIALDALLLIVVLAVLALRLDFPILTARQAMEATQARHLFGPGRAIAAVDRQAVPYRYSRYYILRHGDWYAWCGVNYVRPFWHTGGLRAVENDPDLPLVPLVVDDSEDGLILVISNDPEIARVMVSFPAYGEDGSGCYLFSNGQDQNIKIENCFLVTYTMSDQTAYYPDDLRVMGYDASGELLYQSPVPESWATRYDLR